MASRSVRLSLYCLALAVLACAPAQAQLAVVDVHAIAQLVTQVRTLAQQLQTARDHLAQAQAEFQSMTGDRGMERLLAGTVRNYLPADWADLDALLTNAGGAFGELAATLQQTVAANAVLTPQQLAMLTPGEQQQIASARASTALMQVLTHEALAATSHRFAALQQLIDAIPTATDQKAILDLQARIGAEQGMLQNEQSKLLVLQRSLQAEEAANQLRIRERIVAGHGQFATRFQATLD